MTKWLNPDEIKKKINEIREETGDKNRIALVTVTESDCPDCEYDDVTNESKDSSCSTCSGIGKLQAESAVTLLAKIRWVTDPEDILMKTGVLPKGGVVFTIDNNYESNVDTIKDSGIDKILIDGIEVKIKKKGKKGSREVNRVKYYAEVISD